MSHQPRIPINSADEIISEGGDGLLSVLTGQYDEKINRLAQLCDTRFNEITKQIERLERETTSYCCKISEETTPLSAKLDRTMKLAEDLVNAKSFDQSYPRLLEIFQSIAGMPKDTGAYVNGGNALKRLLNLVEDIEEAVTALGMSFEFDAEEKPASFDIIYKEDATAWTVLKPRIQRAGITVMKGTAVAPASERKRTPTATVGELPVINVD